MSDNDNEFRIRPGRPRSTRAQRAKPFISQVLRAAKRASNATGSGATAKLRRGGGAPGRSTFGRGRNVISRNRLFGSHRRVVAKARIARHQGRAFRSAPISAHLSYLKREGVSRDGEAGVMFDAGADNTDDLAFADRCQDDRHHFRFIISPEDAADMGDLRAFTRDLVRQMEADLGTRLDWVAVDHWNTDNPHVHLIIRGIDETGADLVISRDYISHGLRGRAEELVDAELGPKPEHEIRSSLTREVDAERWTRLDREIARQANELGYIDLRPEAKGPDDPELRRLLVARLRHLEKLGLAADAGIGEWFVEPGAERTLRELGQRGDIIKTMHKAFAGLGEERGVTDFTIDAGRGGPPIIGRLVDKGLHDELSGQAYAVIDGTDGRAHHVRLRGIEAFENAPPIGGIVEVRRFGGPDDPRPTIILANRSDLDLKSQIAAQGATWLDHRLVEREPMPLGTGGFGREVREAMDARAEHLADEGLARRESQRIVLQRNLLNTLRRRELDAVGTELATGTGMAHLKPQAGEHVSGTYRRQLALSSGRFAVIEGISPDGGRGFQLVPWSREIEHKLGQHISGVTRSGGSIDWSLGRKRDLGL
ncbi:relaxase/mobilization nuclease domain-containing protein [Aquamicrobium segne]|uniref:Relaxase/mobilization nuclease domain-containing protein n=1 Tax=Aquamicrobium segne TaxID=469547 RepID=A0ABW0H0M0_9HYPH